MNVAFETNAEPYPDPDFDGIQIHEGKIVNYHKKRKNGRNFMFYCAGCSHWRACALKFLMEA
jgi:hypothetical protein